MDLKKDMINKLKKEVGNDNKPTKSNKTSKYNQPLNNTNIQTMMLEQKLNKLFYTMRDNLEEKRAGLHASSIISSDESFCYRAQVLSLLFEQTQGHETPLASLKIFAAGNSIHEKWQNMFAKGGICVKNEARSFSEKYELYFTPDSIVNINNELQIVEIKSMNTYSFKSAKSHPSGQKQCMLYMHLLGIEKGFVLAEDKNNQDFKIFPVIYDYKQVLPYIDRLNEIQEMKKEFLENKLMPARKCKDLNDKHGNDCQMKDCCFNVGIGRKRLK